MTPLIAKIFASVLFWFWPQYVAVPFTHTAATAPVTVIMGGTIQDATDSGNALFLIATPFLTSATILAPSSVSCSVWIGNPGAANWGCGIYTDNSSSPGNLVCSAFSSTTPSSGVNTLALSGCGTLSQLTQYWVAQISTSNTQEQGTVHTGTPNATAVCGSTSLRTFFSNSPISSFTSNASWPSTFPASAEGGNGCYSQWINYTYIPTAPYTVVQAGGYMATTEPNTFSFLSAVTSGHSFYVATVAGTNANPATGVVDMTGGSTSDTLTQRGTCSGVTGGGWQVCIWSIDRATAGVNGISASFTQGSGGWHNIVLYAEVAGTLSSSSYDTSAYDTSYITTASFTTANSTPTTAQATELLIGVASDAADCTGLTCYFTGGGGWTALFNDTNEGSGFQFPGGIFAKTVTSTGSYTLSGSINGTSAASILGGLAAFK